jgi:hypothetical protein
VRDDEGSRSKVGHVLTWRPERTVGVMGCESWVTRRLEPTMPARFGFNTGPRAKLVPFQASPPSPGCCRKRTFARDFASGDAQLGEVPFTAVTGCRWSPFHIEYDHLDPPARTHTQTHFRDSLAAGLNVRHRRDIDDREEPASELLHTYLLTILLIYKCIGADRDRASAPRAVPT